MKSKNIIKLALIAFTFLGTSSIFAQEVDTTSISQEIDSTQIQSEITTEEIAVVLEEDTIYPIVEQLQSEMKVAKRLKITGYIQAQYQVADTAGISTIAGDNFAAGIDNRIMIRRGRLKFAYDNEFSQAVLQFDITEKGLGIKDAYLSITEPWLKTASITGGVFDRPFGYEISYSSSTRETPERSRVFQTLFPGERDLGGKFSLQAPKTSNLNIFRLDLGYINGNGPAVETDNYKDIVGRFSVTKVSTNEKFKWGLGASYYNGGFAATTVNKYSMKTVNGERGFVQDSVEVGDKMKREYLGFDGQVSLDWALGVTQIRAEYITGTQPATAASSSSLRAANTSSSSIANLTTGKVTTSNIGVDVYSRQFQGYYVYFIQNILQSPVQLVVKYDLYDPNTAVSGNQIGATTTVAGMKKTSEADALYSTLGLGVNYKWNSNVKIMAYYDMVTNETTSNISNGSTLKNLTKDRNDNVFTLRVQYKF